MGVLVLTHDQAWNEGSNLRTALKHRPEETRMAVIRMVKDVVDFVEAKRTLTSVEDITFTAEAIIQGFPTLKLEELAMCCRDMKMGRFGKYYERLKTSEFTEAITQVEGERAAILERNNQPPPTRGLREGQELIPHETETLLDVIKRRSDWHNG